MSSFISHHSYIYVNVANIIVIVRWQAGADRRRNVTTRAARQAALRAPAVPAGPIGHPAGPRQVRRYCQ